MEETKQPNILMVDDDRFLLDMYSLKFKKSGVVTDTASSAQVALEKLRSGLKYDVIIIDIIMPSLDGLELLKTIKDEKLGSDAIIIMLTNQADDSEKVKSLGVHDYIIKATTIPSEVVQKVLLIYKNKHKK